MRRYELLASDKIRFVYVGTVQVITNDNCDNLYCTVLVMLIGAATFRQILDGSLIFIKCLTSHTHSAFARRFVSPTLCVYDEFHQGG